MKNSSRKKLPKPTTLKNDPTDGPRFTDNFTLDRSTSAGWERRWGWKEGRGRGTGWWQPVFFFFKYVLLLLLLLLLLCCCFLCFVLLICWRCVFVYLLGMVTYMGIHGEVCLLFVRRMKRFLVYFWICVSLFVETSRIGVYVVFVGFGLFGCLFKEKIMQKFWYAFVFTRITSPRRSASGARV